MVFAVAMGVAGALLPALRGARGIVPARDGRAWPAVGARLDS
jgi:hypothetical protein